ncbi:MAG: putative DNA-binding domain-containing protein [Myxococcota bacterium]
MHRVCFGEHPSEEDLDRLGSRERWLVYRNLVRNRLRHVVGAALPRTKEALGDAFAESVERWFQEGGPATRYFRQVPREFHAHAAASWKTSAPPWVSSLAEYEIARWNVRYAPSNDDPVDEFAFDRVPLLNPALQVLRLSHAVHETPTPSDGYPEQPTVLCVYRSKDHRPVPWTLNPIAASLVEAWIGGEKTVTESVHEVATAHGAEIGEAFVEKLSTMIADFLTRGVLLGARPQ